MKAKSFSKNLTGALLCVAALANAKTVLVFAPHPDDEVLGFSGIIKTALNDGDKVKVVLATDGNVCKYGERNRTAETVAGLNALGLGSDNIILMGYRNGILAEIYRYSDENQLGMLSPYLMPNCPNRDDDWFETMGDSDPHPEFHAMVFGASAPMNRANFRHDMETILKGHMPEDVYVTGMHDHHEEHCVVFRFVMDALVKIKKAAPAYSPRVHETTIHPIDRTSTWPAINPSNQPIPLFTAPPQLETGTSLKWQAIESAPVPDAMVATPWNDPYSNLKYKAIWQHQSQVNPLLAGQPVYDYLTAFVKKDEFFWRRDISNLALLATATSSNPLTAGQSANKAIDGIIDGACDNTGCTNENPGREGLFHLAGNEWAANSAQAWIQLTWPRTYTIDRVVLYDRIQNASRITNGTLTFSDGSAPINNISLANNGSGNAITLNPPRTVSWIKFTVTGSSNSNPGLAEFEVFQRNLAKYAAVTASTQNTSTGQSAIKAIDGSIDGFPHDQYKEWATQGQLGGAWIRLTWTQNFVIDRVNLFDRTNQGDQVISGTLFFSDGTTVPVGVLSNSGAGNTIRFRPRSTSWVEFSINNATGFNTGLAEFEAYEALTPAQSNHALYATAASSTENSVTGQLAGKVNDGVKDGFPGDFTKEWATTNQNAGAWVQLNFTQPVSISKAMLFDRPNSGDWIQSGTLLFSNGTSVPVGALNNSGTGLTVNFSPRTVSWIRFRVDSVSGAGANTGLSEFEVY